MTNAPRPARQEIFVQMANAPKLAREEFLGLPSKLFLELEPLYLFVQELFSTGVPPAMTEEQRALSIRWVEFGCMNEQDPVAHRLIARLFEEYKQERIRRSKPTTEDEMASLLAEIASLRLPDEKPNKEVLWQIFEEEHEGRLFGVKTGIPFVDEATLGFKPGHLWVIGGFTNVGKSMLMNDLVLNTAHEHSTAVFSLEMPRRDILHRLLREARWRLGDNGKAMDLVSDLSLTIEDSKTSLSSILASLQIRKTMPEIVWIDFIQNVYTPDRTEYERMTNIARDLQAFARENKTCVVALSQISNEAANSPTKTAGYKGSGAIEAACDVGIVLSRDKEETTDHVEFLLSVKKNRHGRTGKIAYQFDKTTGRIMYHPL